MRKLARHGGLESCRTRLRKKVAKMLEIALVPAELVQRRKYAGGSHSTDWWCPECKRFNSFKRRCCAKCCKAPGNGRHTRAWFRSRAEEHKTAAILARQRLQRADIARVESGLGRGRGDHHNGASGERRERLSWRFSSRSRSSRFLLAAALRKRCSPRRAIAITASGIRMSPRILLIGSWGGTLPYVPSRRIIADPQSRHASFGLFLLPVRHV
jgi:hypothetical protein